MEEFLAEAGERHPEIWLRDGFISIKGHSILRDPKKFYKPVIQWVKSYVKDPPRQTIVTLQIDFSDSRSTKTIFEILKTLAACQNTNHGIEMIFNWVYIKEDGAIRELGEFFESKLNVSFIYFEEISHISQ